MSTPAATSEGPGRLPIVFYDGACGLCHRTVRFLLDRDPEGRRLRFAPLGGETFEALVEAPRREALPDSVVVLEPDGVLHVRSDATAFLCRQAGGLVGVWGRVLPWFPKRLRDGVYDLIAASRHRFWARPVDACPVGTPELRARFDP